MTFRDFKALSCILRFLTLALIWATPAVAQEEFQGGAMSATTRLLFAQPDASSAPPILRAGTEKVRDEYLIMLRDDIPKGDVVAAAEELQRLHGFRLRKVWSDAVKGFFGEMTDEKAEKLSKHGAVALVEENARWNVSSEHATYVAPEACDPTTTACQSTADNRLWHLDRLDQNSSSPNNAYKYCDTGAGVTVYVVDSGVHRNHQEFAPGTRVLDGFNATEDNFPAHDPCLGFALPPAPGWELVEPEFYNQETGQNGHGTGVASVIAGNRVGVAKGVTIIPVKVMRCDYNSARARQSSRTYQVNETMFRGTGYFNSVLYRAIVGGQPGASEPDWGTPMVGQIIDDGGVRWQVVTIGPPEIMTSQHIIDGLNWIRGPNNAGPKTNAIVSLSVFKKESDPGAAGPANTVEASIRNLLADGMIVIASANNQNGNACNTVPARMSINNPDSAERGDVITVGGSMLRNRPWPTNASGVEANGAQPAFPAPGKEPDFVASKGVVDARWICGAGDSSPCSNRPVGNPLWTPNPTHNEYSGATAGSNGGPCVTLFAPAKNVAVASIAGTDRYRDPRAQASFASGTSWSAPFVAGVAARILATAAPMNSAAMRNALLSNAEAVLDPETLDPYDHDGNRISNTPNALLRYSGVAIVSHPQSSAAATIGDTPLSFQANASGSITWFRVNDGFDLVKYKRGAHFGSAPYSSSSVFPGTSSTLQAPSNVRAGYWARVTTPCGTADTDVAVVVPPPSGSPGSVQAVAQSGGVLVSWNQGSASGVERYVVERRTVGTAWQQVAVLSAVTFSLLDTPQPPDGIVAYRMRAASGYQILPETALAVGPPSMPDYANLNAVGYEVLVPPPSGTTMKAIHVTELRAAVNSIAAIFDQAAPFSSEGISPSSLVGQAVSASHFNEVLARLNEIRVSAGLTPVTIQNAPAIGAIVERAHLQELRDAFN